MSVARIRTSWVLLSGDEAILGNTLPSEKASSPLCPREGPAPGPSQARVHFHCEAAHCRSPGHPQMGSCIGRAKKLVNKA